MASPRAHRISRKNGCVFHSFYISICIWMCKWRESRNQDSTILFVCTSNACGNMYRNSMCTWNLNCKKMHMEFPRAFGNDISKFEMAFQKGRCEKVQRRATRFDEIPYEERLRFCGKKSDSLCWRTKKLTTLFQLYMKKWSPFRVHCELQIAWEEQYEGIICRARYVLIRKHERQGLGTGLERRRTFNWDIFLIIVKWGKGRKSFHDYQKSH